MIRQICTTDKPYIKDDIPYMYEDNPYMCEDNPYMCEDNPYLHRDKPDMCGPLTPLANEVCLYYHYFIV